MSVSKVKSWIFRIYCQRPGKIQPSPSKTLAVQNFPQPKSLKQVQSLLGLTGYFRKFIPLYTQIAKLLYDLLQNRSLFKFGPEQEEAFVKLKKRLSCNQCWVCFNKDSLWSLQSYSSQERWSWWCRESQNTQRTFCNIKCSRIS